MKDEPLSESLSPVFEEIKNLIRSGNAEEAHNHFLALLNQTASSEVVEGYLAFACDYFSRPQVLANLVDSCSAHFQEGNLSRTALKLNLVIKALSDIMDMQAENLPSFHLLSSASASMKNPSQFAALLKESLLEQEFQNNGEELQQAVNRFLALLDGASLGTPVPSSPPASSAPKSSTAPKPPPTPSQGGLSAPAKVEKFAPAGGGGKPAGVSHGFFGSLDEPMYDAPEPQEPTAKAPTASAPKGKPPSLDTPLGAEDDLPSPPPSKMSKAISFDMPLDSAQEETHSQQEDLTEKLERDVASLIAANQLREAIAFCEEILTLSPGRNDIQKKIQFLRSQMLSQNSQKSAKSLVKTILLVCVLIFGVVGAYMFLGMNHATQLRTEFKEVFNAKEAPQEIAQIKTQIMTEANLVKCYQLMKASEAKNPYQKFETLKGKSSSFGYSYHVYMLNLELDRIKIDADTYKTISEEIANVIQTRAADFMNLKTQETDEYRKTLTIESYEKAVKSIQDALNLAQETQDSKNVAHFQKNFDECKTLLDTLYKRKEQAEKEMESRLADAQKYLQSIQEAIAKKDFAKAFEQSQKLLNDNKLLSLEICSNLKIPIAIRSNPDAVEVTQDGQNLGIRDHILFPYQEDKITLKFSQKGFEAQTKTLFKNDIQATIEVSLGRGTFWTLKTGGPIEATLQIQDTTLYVVNRNAKFFAIDAKNGKELWSLKVTEGLADIVLPFLIKNGKAYCLSTDRKIYCVDLKTHDFFWSMPPILPKPSKSALVALDEDLLCFGLQKSLMFLSAKSGKILTEWETPAIVVFTPQVSKDSLYFADNEKGYYRIPISALKEKLNQKEKPKLKSKTKLEGMLTTTPFLDSENHHYLCLDTRNLVCLKEEEKSFVTQWKFPVNDIIESPPILVEKVLYFTCNDKNIYAVDINTGKAIWQFQTENALKYSPGVDENAVYVSGQDNIVYCLDRSSGKLLWKKTFEKTLENTPVFYQGLLYVCDSDGVIHALIRN